MKISWPTAIICIDYNYLGWFMWAYMRLTVIDRAFLALAEQTLEILPVTLLMHFIANPARTQMNSIRVRSARGRSQHWVTASGRYENSRVRCRTTHSRWWNLTTFNFNCANKWHVLWFTLKNDLDHSYYKVPFWGEVYVGFTIFNNFQSCYYKLHWSDAYSSSIQNDGHYSTNAVK